jgi:hypothetical protein
VHFAKTHVVDGKIGIVSRVKPYDFCETGTMTWADFHAKFHKVLDPSCSLRFAHGDREGEDRGQGSDDE